MIYNIKNHETRYKNILFRSRLEARWAAYFDLLGLYWEYEPIDLNGWTPDFLLDIPCGHSECENGTYGNNHRLLVEVKPYSSIEEFKGHPCMDYPYGHKYVNGLLSDIRIPADSSAAFGINPFVTEWQCVHGAGGGYEKLETRGYSDENLWNIAGEKVRYIK